MVQNIPFHSLIFTVEEANEGQLKITFILKCSSVPFYGLIEVLPVYSSIVIIYIVLFRERNRSDLMTFG